MTRPTTSQPGLRYALKAGLIALSVTGGATWLMAGDGGGTDSGNLRVAQATAQPATGDAAGTSFSDKQKDEIERIIKSYLLANPEIMLDVQSALELKMEQIQADKMKSAISSNASEIYRSKGAPVAGNPSGDVTVVEFFDYNCGYCKRAFTDLASVVEEDKKLKLVLKELPILSKGSEEAARVALAAKLQGKYWEVHQALIGMRGRADEASALKAAATVKGVDVGKLKRDMTAEDVNDEIKRVRDLAQRMGIQGTPHFLVGDRSIAGAPTDLQQQIKTHAAELRKSGGCKVC